MSSTNNNNFTCLYCKNKFHNSTLLANHCIKTTSHENPCRCSCTVCNQELDSTAAWGRHFLSKHGSTNTCPLCKNTFSDVLQLAAHCQENHVGVSHSCRCKICSEPFDTTAAWGMHFLERHDSHCPLCHTENEDLMALAQHCVVKHGRESYNHCCKICQKSFYSLSAWGGHFLRRHHQCPGCSLMFGNLLLFAEHCAEKHVGLNFPCSCKICGKHTFQTAAEWGNHVLKHLGVTERKATTTNIESKPVSLYQSLLQQIAFPALNTKQKHLIDTSIKRENQPLITELTELQREWTGVEKLTAEQLSALVQKHNHFLMRVQEEEDSKQACIVCFENKRAVICVPCGHVIYCFACMEKMAEKSCALCRNTVDRFLKIF